MKHTCRLSDYLRGDRRGKDANCLEREALADPFLCEAVDGLTGVEGDHPRIISGLVEKVEFHVRPHLRYRVLWGALLLAVVIGAVVLWRLQAGEKVKQTDAAGLVVAADSLPENNSPASVEDNVGPGEAIDTAGVTPEPPIRGNYAIRLEIGEKLSGTSLPLKGIEDYNRYIQEFVHYPADALRDGTEGNVKISFIVNSHGRPSRIRVVEWISQSCSQAAIRLLEEGPEWKYTGSGTPTTIILSFRIKK